MNQEQWMTKRECEKLANEHVYNAYATSCDTTNDTTKLNAVLKRLSILSKQKHLTKDELSLVKALGKEASAIAARVLWKHHR